MDLLLGVASEHSKQVGGMTTACANEDRQHRSTCKCSQDCMFRFVNIYIFLKLYLHTCVDESYCFCSQQIFASRMNTARKRVHSESTKHNQTTRMNKARENLASRFLHPASTQSVTKAASDLAVFWMCSGCTQKSSQNTARSLTAKI